MSRIYKRVMVGCAIFAGLGASVYTALTIAALIEGPTSELRISWRANNIVVVLIVVPTLISANAWTTYHSAQCAAQQIADRVSATVEANMEQLLYSVAANASRDGRDQLVDAIKSIATAVGEEVTDGVRTHLDAFGRRMHTSGMVDEAQARAREASTNNGGTVSSLLSQRR